MIAFNLPWHVIRMVHVNYFWNAAFNLERIYICLHMHVCITYTVLGIKVHDGSRKSVVADLASAVTFRRGS